MAKLGTVERVLEAAQQVTATVDRIDWGGKLAICDGAAVKDLQAALEAHDRQARSDKRSRVDSAVMTLRKRKCDHRFVTTSEADGSGTFLKCVDCGEERA